MYLRYAPEHEGKRAHRLELGVGLDLTLQLVASVEGTRKH
jgi:hypothetical protein